MPFSAGSAFLASAVAFSLVSSDLSSDFCLSLSLFGFLSAVAGGSTSGPHRQEAEERVAERGQLAGELDRAFDALFAAHGDDADFVAAVGGAEGEAEIGLRFDWFAVELDDSVAFFESGLAGGRIGADGGQFGGRGVRVLWRHADAQEAGALVFAFFHLFDAVGEGR